MNKEYFKILKEINSLESDIASLESENQEEGFRVDKLKEREREQEQELAMLQESLKEKRIDSQKNENTLASLDAKLQKTVSDLRSSFDSKHLEALELERQKLEAELEQTEGHGLEILEKIDELETEISEKEEFLRGIDGTIQEIQEEVNVVFTKNQKEIDSKKNRVERSLAELPQAFQTAYESLWEKELPISSFSKIVAGKCDVCKMAVDKTKQSQVEDQLSLKTCSCCGRIFIPNQALY